MPHVLTVLEARVAPERAADLLAAYAEAARGPFPPGLVRSALLREAADPTKWRLETTWKSHDALAAMRQAPGKPRGVQIFEAANAHIFDVAADFVAPAGAAALDPPGPAREK
jgi:quinol monooxygenase YgiN